MIVTVVIFRCASISCKGYVRRGGIFREIFNQSVNKTIGHTNLKTLQRYNKKTKDKKTKRQKDKKTKRQKDTKTKNTKRTKVKKTKQENKSTKQKTKR